MRQFALGRSWYPSKNGFGVLTHVRACLLIFWLIAAPCASRAESPVRFARGGQTIAIRLAPGDDAATEPPFLTAFGRRWDVEIIKHKDSLELVAPVVRVPVVFRFKACTADGPDLGELVVYPDRPVPWDEHTPLAAFNAPDWFRQWARAMNLPVLHCRDRGSLKTIDRREKDIAALLILGENTAGRGSQVLRLASEFGTNIFVLGTGWYGDNVTARRDTVLTPESMAGPLADLKTQNWALPPEFVRPGIRVLNRRTWIAGGEYPLVEEVFGRDPGTDSLRIVLSYLPWDRLLGRTETADDLFLRLLAEAAKGADTRHALDGRIRLLYPPAEEIEAGNRPVLAAVKSGECTGRQDAGDQGAGKRDIRGSVLDLRGGAAAPADFARSREAEWIERHVDERRPLLILGDDPILDKWKWLQVDSSCRRSTRQGVVWWPDDSLPSSVSTQLRLMRLFTEWDVFLRDIRSEVEHEDNQNAP